MTEALFHKQVADFLSVALDQSAWFTTFPLGGGGRLRGAINKGLGTKEGIPDILIIHQGRAVWLELKTTKGRVSPAQSVCHENLDGVGSLVFVCRRLEDVITALNMASIPTRVLSLNSSVVRA